MNNNQLTDMIQTYFECGRNSGQALRLYVDRFPDREVPDRRKFARLERNLRNYGAFKKPKRKERQFDEDVEFEVLLSVEENPRTSTREIANNIGVSQQSVQAILKKHKFIPYVPQKVQALVENDRDRREQFCRHFLNAMQQDRTFYRKIIWTDECTFTNNGIFNRNNHRYWSQENPRIIVPTNFQNRFSVNVWCGIWCDRLIGPFFIDGALNQQRYHQLLHQNIEHFLEELPVADLNRIYFQQDGAPAHNAQINVDWLNATFAERWIGTYGPVRWPPRSPDLTPLDFWLWGYLKDRVYLSRPENLETLQQRIIDVCREIPPNFIWNATHGVIRRCELCVQQGGGQFEQYL